MSQNKKRTKPGPLPQVPPPVAQTVTDNEQNRRINRAFIVAAGSVLLSLVGMGISLYAAWAADRSALAAAEANRLTREAQDRAAGKVPAKFQFVEDAGRDPNRQKQYMRPKVGSGELVFRLESPDELVRWVPLVRVRNTGADPIDAIRVEVRHDIGAAYGRGVQQIDPMPVIFNDTTSYEAANFGKLMPGQTARLTLAQPLLEHLTRDWVPEYADQDRFGVFHVRVNCRLVGASSYDLAEDRRPVTLQFHWRPAGFKPDAKNVKEALGIGPYVTIE